MGHSLRKNIEPSVRVEELEEGEDQDTHEKDLIKKTSLGNIRMT